MPPILPTPDERFSAITTLSLDRLCTDFSVLTDPQRIRRRWANVTPLEIGQSRAHIPMLACEVGEGPEIVSVIAGCHADEPIGPLTALALPDILSLNFPGLLDRYTFRIIPQMNPDGAQRNAVWYANPPAFAPYWKTVTRELPGDDIEFGFGDATSVRPECAAAMAFMRARGPVAAHFSLHGLAMGRGAWFLLDPAWVSRSEPLMADLASLCGRLNVPLHDEPRDGAKGFARIREGFCTTPNSAAMRDHFLQRNDPDTASRFHPNSMEFARSLGGDPFCAVSELPLFLYEGNATGTYAALKAALKEGNSPEALERDHPVKAMPVELQMRLQLGLILLALHHLP
ncbi:MAG: peptidase M14 [Candidatus Hydrogenedentota bacterium]